MGSYSTDTCERILTHMLDYEARHFTEPALHGGFTIINNVTNTRSQLKYKQVEEYPSFCKDFDKIGHAFGVDGSSSYVVPFMLDIDCVECAAKTVHPPVEPSALKILRDDIVKVVERILQEPVTTCVMVRRHHCGCHIYFNVSVSIFVYDYLVGELKKHITIYPLLLDRISTFPLPFSTKHDGQHYSELQGTGQDIHVFPSLPYYDFPNLSIVKCIDNVVMIGEYTKESGDTIPEWADLSIETSYLVRPKDSIPKPTFAKPQHKHKLHLAKFSSKSHNDCLDAYMNAAFESTDTENVTFDPLHDRAVVHDLTQLATKISLIAYNNHSKGQEVVLSFLFSMLRAKNHGYAFYILISIMVYLIDSKGHDFTTVRDLLLDLMKNRNVVGQSILEHTHNSVIFDKVKCSFAKPVEWLDWMCRSVRAEHHTEITLDIPSAAVRLLSIFPCFKQSSTSSMLFVYDGGVYHTQRDQNIFKMASYLKAESSILTQMAILPKEQRAVKERLRIEILTLIGEKEVDLNDYPFFLNTQRGVFNTLCSMYMEKTPLLYFNTSLGMFIDPETLIEAGFINTFIERQCIYFYSIILIPGLLALPESVVTLDVCENILSATKDIIRRDKNFDKTLFDVLTETYNIPNDTLNTVRNLVCECYRVQQSVTLAELYGCDFGAPPDSDDEDPRLWAIALVIVILDRFTKQRFTQHQVTSSCSQQQTQLTTIFNVADESLAHVLFSLCVWCEFDAIKLGDLLHVMAYYFTPNNPRKFVTLLIGSTSSGKSTLLSWVRSFSQPSFYPMSCAMTMNYDAAAAAPDVKMIASTYAVGIAELVRMDTSFLKILTGSDTINRRGLYETEGSNLKPCAFILGASNEVPVIQNADEAIRTRLAPFEFNTCFVGPEADNVLDLNPLVLYAGRNVLKENFDQRKAADAFCRILYASLIHFRDDNGNLAATITNTSSESLIGKILRKNNIIYRMLHQQNIIFDRNLSITASELEDSLEVALGRPSNNIKNPETLKGQAKFLLTTYRSMDGKSYFGIGKSTMDNVPDIEPLEESTTLGDLKRKLMAKHNDPSEVNNKLTAYINHYKRRKVYNVQKREFTL